MPYICLFGTPGLLVMFVIIWFKYPKSLRDETRFRHSAMRAFVLAVVMILNCFFLIYYNTLFKQAKTSERVHTQL